MKTQDLTQNSDLLGHPPMSPKLSPTSSHTTPGPSTPDSSSHPRNQVLAFPLCYPLFLPYSSPGEFLFVFQDMWLICHHLQILFLPSQGQLLPEAQLAKYHCSVIVPSCPLRPLGRELLQDKLTFSLVSVGPVRGTQQVPDTYWPTHCLCHWYQAAKYTIQHNGIFIHSHHIFFFKFKEKRIV